LVRVVDDVGVADVKVWASGLGELQARIGRRFSRSEPRARALAYLRGLLAPLERKNGWTLAEQAGEANPDGMQRLLSTADWDADRVRDDLRDYVVEHLGDADAVLVVDETGFLKKGIKSAGVARQYSGTAGRIENCQVGVFLGYATGTGRTFIDRELYLPKAWTDDPARRREAGIDESVEFATKPELAIAMLTRALDAAVPAAWLTGDEVYGQHPGLRRFCEDRELSYVLAVPSNQYVWVTPAGQGAPRQTRAAALADTIAPQAFKRISAGAGAKGPRIYHWARVELHPRPDGGARRWLLVRRSLADGERAYYLCHAPAATSLADLVRVAGTRWAIEETFQTSKGEVGLDHYQVRRYDGWYRHITLAMFAHAFLTVIRAAAGKRGRSIPA
jgi:SRSO17 transposase